MAKCKNCTNLYNLSDENDVIVGKWCPKISDSPDVEAERKCGYYKCMTQADRIRSFSDEELADLLTIQRTCHCADGRCLGAKYCYYHTPGGEGCREAILRHLQEEAEEEV